MQDVAEYYADVTFPEPYSTATYTTEQKEYTAMCESVKKYGGFYIARYEASAEFIEISDEEEEILITSKKGQEPITNIPWGNEMDDVGKSEADGGAVYWSRKMYEASTSVVSTLCYGVQWDAIMKFVEDKDHDIVGNSSGWGNTSDSDTDGAGELHTTGYNPEWAAKNIYDLAGNVSEWTMEPVSFKWLGTDYLTRVVRGGYYGGSGSDFPAALRVFGSAFTPSYTFSYLGFRPALYIK